jgi:hypothetical protein
MLLLAIKTMGVLAIIKDPIADRARGELRFDEPLLIPKACSEGRSGAEPSRQSQPGPPPGGLYKP